MPYEVDGDPYLFLPKLAKHQRLEPDKVKSRLPEPPEATLAPPEPDPTPPPAKTGRSEPGANMSARRADESESRADESERRADKSALLYVAGGMEHVAGGRGSRAGARETPPVGTLGNSLLEEHRRQVTPTPPRDVTRRTGEQIDLLLDDPVIEPDEIRAGRRCCGRTRASGQAPCRASSTRFARRPRTPNLPQELPLASSQTMPSSSEP